MKLSGERINVVIPVVLAAGISCKKVLLSSVGSHRFAVDRCGRRLRVWQMRMLMEDAGLPVREYAGYISGVIHSDQFLDALPLYQTT